MTLEGQEFLTGDRVPDFAGPIVGTSDKLAAALVKRTISQGKEMGLASLEVSEALLKVFLLLFNELLDEFLEGGFARLGDEGLFEQDLVDQSVDISPIVAKKRG